MPDHISDQLGAYLDGELDRRGQSEVQAHLATCPACQNELEELRRISHLLHAAPQPDFTPALTFKAQLMLQLPRRASLPSSGRHSEEAQDARPISRLLPWLAPVLVLAVWIFVQVTVGLSTLVSLANQTGLLDGAAAWANSAPQQTLWYSAAQATFGGLLGPGGQTGLYILNDAGLFAQNLLILLLLQVGATVLYWGALALAWHYKVKPLWTSPAAG